MIIVIQQVVLMTLKKITCNLIHYSFLSHLSQLSNYISGGMSCLMYSSLHFSLLCCMFQMSTVKRLEPRLQSIALKLGFSEMVADIKPVSMNSLFCNF